MMKRFLLACLTLSMLACQKSGTPSYHIDNNLCSVTKADMANSNNFFVNESEVRLLIGKKGIYQELRSYPSKDNVLFYVVPINNQGYYIISADKRANPIIAFSDDTDFNESAEDINFLIQEYTEPIIAIQSSNCINEAMQFNIDTWNFITTRIKIMPSTKTTAMTYYYLIESEDVQYDSPRLGPLLNTRWGQTNKNPGDCYWNYYCPSSSTSTTTNRCPAGCVAVAGGQFAHYIKDRSGVSIGIPRSASCTGYSIDGSNSNYTQSFNILKSFDYIHEMPMDYNETDSDKIEHARIFLAYIGKRTGMTYFPTASATDLSSLSSLFSRWNIESSHIGFSHSEARQMLSNNTPVIVGAKRDEEHGHSWLIDGYKKTYTVRKNYYYISSTQLTDVQIDALTMQDWNGGYDEWEMPPITSYHMNWGNNGSNDGWFAYDNWIVADRNYCYNKEMIQCNQYD